MTNVTTIPLTTFQVLEDCLSLVLKWRYEHHPSDPNHISHRLCLRFTFLMLTCGEHPSQQRFWEIHALHRELIQYLKLYSDHNLNLDRYSFRPQG